MQVQGSSGLSPIYHLTEVEEESCKDIADLIFRDVKTDPPELAHVVFINICSNGFEGNTRILSNVCRVFSKGNYEDKKVQAVRRLCFERLCSNFDLLSPSTQIEFAKRTGEQSALAGYLVTQGKLDQVLNHWEAFELSPLDRLDLCKLIARQGRSEAHKLVEQFDKLGLDSADPKDHLNLCKLIAGNGDSVATFLVVNIHKFKLDGIDVQDRCDLGKFIAGQGWEAAIELARRIGYWSGEFDSKDKLELFKLIVQQGNYPAEGLFNTLNLSSMPVSKRLYYCNLFLSWGKHAGWALASSFERYKLNEIDMPDRLNLCKLIAKQGERAAAMLVEQFDKLGLDSVDLKVRLDLCRLIVEQGDIAAKALAFYFDRLNLGGIEDEQNRFELCKLIVGQGSGGALVFANNFGFGRFNLGGINAQNRMELCKIIAEQGVLAAQYLLRNLKHFKLDELDEQTRFELCKIIARQGDEAAKMLVNFFREFKLEGSDVQDRLELCKLIVAQGISAISAIRENFDQWNLDPDACISLARFIAGLDLRFIEHFDQITSKMKDSTKRQMYLEFSKPPSSYRGRKEPSLSDAFRSESEVSLFTVLQRQPTDSVEESMTALKEFVKVFEKINPLEPILMKLKGEPDGHLKSVMLNWTAYAAGVLYDVVEAKQRLDSTTPSEEPSALMPKSHSQIKVGTLADEAIKAWKSIKKSGILLDIYEHKNPSARYLFMRLLSDIAKHYPEKLPTRRESQKPWVSLSRLLISPLRGFGLEEECIEALLKRISEKDFSVASDFRSLIYFFEALIDHGPFSNEEITSVMDIALGILEDIPSGKQKDRRTLKQGLDQFDGLTNILKIFGKKQFVDCVKNNINLKVFFGQQFQGLFELEDVEAIFDKYSNTFGKFRDDTALYSYLRSVQGLPPSLRKPVLDGLKTYVRAVLEGDFPEIRYNEATSKHLEKIFADPVIKEKWRATAEPAEILLQSQENLDIDYINFFKTKILVDEHINPKTVPRLVSFLNGEGVEILESGDPLDELQNLAIQLIRQEIDVDQFTSGVRALRDIPAPFQNDLDALKHQQIHFDKHTIQESDDPCDLLLIGTEIKGSCQSVKGRPDLNMCLVSYLMNGEIRAIVIKDAEGKIVARSVIRLLLDEKTQTLTILAERVYSNVAGNVAQEAIEKWAIAKAQEMNVPLVSKEVGQGPGYQGTVEHLGGYAPFIYSDAAVGNRVISGPYKISRGLHILHSPSPVSSGGK